MFSVRKAIIAACVFFAGAALISGETRAEARDNFFHPRYRTLPDKTAMQKHYLFDFVPKFKKADCLVRFDFTFAGTADERSRAPLDILFQQYLWAYEPKAGHFFLKYGVPTANRSIPAYVQFIDECDRRFEIAEAIAAYAHKTDPWYKIKVSRNHILPGPDTIIKEGYWIDDSNFDGEIHELLRKAVRGDGEAMFLYAEKIYSIENFLGAYQMYRRAINCLPPGPLRAKAAFKAQETLSAIPPQRKEKIGDFLKYERKKSIRLGIVCLP